MIETKTDRAVGERGQRPAITTRALWPFLAIAFGLGWGLAIVGLVFTDQIEAIFGEIGEANPLFILAVWSPAIAGISLVWRHYGVAGLGSYFRRLTMWRMPWAWWALLIFGIPAVKYLGAAINGTIGEFAYSPWYDVLPAMGFMLILGPVEELGWRGVALPLLQRRYAPLWAGLILGAIWGIWHLPSFLLSGTPQSAWDVGPYLIGVLAISVLVTPMFNAARGSILVAALFHYQLNFPVWPEAQPWENYILAVLAMAVVYLNRASMLGRSGGVTDVLMADRVTEQPVAAEVRA